MNHISFEDFVFAKFMPRKDQNRILAILGAVLVGLSVLFVGLRWLLTPAPPVEVKLPAGTFRPTAAQLHDMAAETVRVGAGEDIVNATGTIVADGDQSTPVLMPYSGQVSQVLVEAGQHVVQGQPLLKVKTNDFVEARDGLFAAQAQLLSAQTQFRTAQDAEMRQGELYRTAGGSLKDYQQAQAARANAQSAVRIAAASLGAARDKLAILGKSPQEIGRLEHAGEVSGIHDETTLHAPIAGVVVERAVSPGQYVGAGGDKPVMTIADPSRVWLVAQLAESEAAEVHPGDVADVTIPAYPGRIFHAVIESVGAALDPLTHRLPLRATLANPDGALKPQMFANFSIHVANKMASIIVPSTAIIREGEGARVWVLRKDGLLAARQVQILDAPAGRTRIVGGLRNGERIITAGAIFVNEAAANS